LPPLFVFKTLLFAANLAAAVSSLVACSSQPAEAWPAEVVRIEQMRTLTPIGVALPCHLRPGKLTGPVVLKVHVGSDGLVKRVSLLESSGSRDHDTESMHAMREMRFRPYMFGGQPIDVTLVVPLHYPVPR
jgi:TonB family protein